MASRAKPIRQVYFVEAERLGLVKIGVATRARHRLRNLQIGSPDRLVLHGVVYTDDPHRLERGYHSTWKHLRRHGEWFEPDDDLREFLVEGLWPADEPGEYPAILFHAQAPTGARGFSVHPTSWCRTVEEVVEVVMRAWEAHQGRPRLA